MEGLEEKWFLVVWMCLDLFETGSAVLDCSFCGWLLCTMFVSVAPT